MAQVLVKERQLLDRYALTETLNSILNGMIAFCGREKVLEQEKSVPDEKKIGQLVNLSKEVRSAQRNNESYETLERMEYLIEHYTPIFDSLKKKPRKAYFQIFPYSRGTPKTVRNHT